MQRCDKCVPAVSRRGFIRFSLGAGAAGLAGASGALDVLGQQGTVAEKRKEGGGKARAVIMLWMGGGPSQIDTFDPKPGQKNGGEFKAIDCAGARGMQVSEHLPITASQGKNINIIRSMCTGQGAHEIGTSLMHLGTRQIPGLAIAPLGTVVSYEKGAKDFPLPHFVAIDPPLIPQSAVFGDEYLPFPLNNAQNPIPNLQRNVGADRDRERAKLLIEQNKDWDSKRQQPEITKIEKAYVKSEDIMNTPLLKAFQYGSDPKASEYKGHFAVNCLMARRLVEAGCSFVEIGNGGWDTHDNNFDALKRKLPEIDNGMGTLIKDLSESGLLKECVVLWCGEFGRTPDINPGKGRDHWANGFSVMMAGGNLGGGRIAGDTGPNGAACNKMVPIQNFFATVYKAVGIDHNKEYVTESRKFKYTEKGSGKPVAELV
jgi:hypothetical protein